MVMIIKQKMKKKKRRNVERQKLRFRATCLVS